jgi:PII-like signaling protein
MAAVLHAIDDLRTLAIRGATVYKAVNSSTAFRRTDLATV